MHGAFFTPGYVCCHRLPIPSKLKHLARRIIEPHSHVGVDSAPSLEGAQDGNSFHGPIISWIHSTDGIKTHDVGYELAAAGGTMTSHFARVC